MFGIVIGNTTAAGARTLDKALSLTDRVSERVGIKLHPLQPMEGKPVSMHSSEFNDIRFYKPDGTLYASLSREEYIKLRDAGKLEYELGKRRGRAFAEPKPTPKNHIQLGRKTKRGA